MFIDKYPELMEMMGQIHMNEKVGEKEFQLQRRDEIQLNKGDEKQTFFSNLYTCLCVFYMVSLEVWSVVAALSSLLPGHLLETQILRLIPTY